MLRAARRPAPPTLREQALADVDGIEDALGACITVGDGQRLLRIRKALQEGADG
jgi:hypothetical protein